jgi:hypothetical protein
MVPIGPIRHLLGLMIVALAANSSYAAIPIPILSNEAELAGIMRGLSLEKLPNPLYQKEKDWGRTKEIEVPRIRRGRLRMATVAKNDGHWRKIRVDAINPRDSLVVDVRNVQRPKPGQMTFELFVAMDVRMDATQEHWENGLKLYGASIRARCRVKATIRCSVDTEAELKNLMPELILRLKVTEAHTLYENLVVEHVAGIGGDGAKLIGAAGHEMIHHWKPSMERDLLEKANQAIVKAGANKEFRIGLERLFKSKSAVK